MGRKNTAREPTEAHGSSANTRHISIDYARIIKAIAHPDICGLLDKDRLVISIRIATYGKEDCQHDN